MFTGHILCFSFLQTEEVEEPIDDDAEPVEEKKPANDDEEDTKVEEETEEKKPKTRKVEKTTWDWELLNNAKPIWTRKYVHTTHNFSHVHFLLNNDPVNSM